MAIQNQTDYKPTATEKRLLEVLLNPENQYKTVTDICLLAKCGRNTYYEAFKKEGFVQLYQAETKNMITQKIAPVVNAFVREAMRGSFQHGKVLLEMAGMYKEKSELDIGAGDGLTIVIGKPEGKPPGEVK